MKPHIDFPPSGSALPAREEPSLRQRTEAASQHSTTGLLALFDSLSPQANKDARHHLRLQQLAFEVQNEELRQMLTAKTVHGHFARCVCGGACTALLS